LELAGVDAPEHALTGRSLVPFLRNEPAPPDWADAVYTQFNGVELYYTQRAVTTRDWKYVYNGFDFDELYDRRADPHEMVNLSDRPEHEAVKRTLVQKMWRFAAEQQDDLLFNGYATCCACPLWSRRCIPQRARVGRKPISSVSRRGDLLRHAMLCQTPPRPAPPRLLLLFSLCCCVTVLSAPPLRATAASQARPYTPRPGSAERAAIMDALRVPVEKELRKRPFSRSSTCECKTAGPF
jgi:hypothetical protein